MPTYEFHCKEGHDFEHRCGISSKPDSMPCPVVIEDAEGEELHIRECGAEAKQVLLTAPPIWIPGVTHQTVLDYPGSKSQKAGHVHTHGYKPATKVQSGYGGMTSTSFRHSDEVANWVKPDGSRGTTPGSST